MRQRAIHSKRVASTRTMRPCPAVAAYDVLPFAQARSAAPCRQDHYHDAWLLTWAGPVLSEMAPPGQDDTAHRSGRGRAPGKIQQRRHLYRRNRRDSLVQFSLDCCVGDVAGPAIGRRDVMGDLECDDGI